MNSSADTLFLFLIVIVLVLAALSLLLVIAAFLLRAANARTAKRWARLESRWTGPAIETLAGSRTPESVRELVGKGEEAFFIRFLMQLAQRVRGGERMTLMHMAAPFLDAVLRGAKRRSPEERAAAIHAASILGGFSRRATLLAALDDPSPLVAMVTARGLIRMNPDAEAARLEDGRAILVRIDRLETWSINFLASTLAAAGPGLAPDLRELALNRSRSAFARVTALTALRRLRNIPAAEDSARIVASEDDFEVIAAALRLLGALRTPSGLDAIRARLGDPNPVLRSHAAGALGNSGTPRDAELLAPLLHDEVPWVAITAARAIRKLGGAELLARTPGLAENAESGE